MLNFQLLTLWPYSLNKDKLIQLTLNESGITDYFKHLKTSNIAYKFVKFHDQQKGSVLLFVEHAEAILQVL